MAGTGLSTTVTKVSRNPQSQRKSLESFVPWKDGTTLERTETSSISAASKSGRMNQRKEILSPSISNPLAGRRHEYSAKGTVVAEPVSMTIRSEGARGLQSGNPRKEGTNAGESSAGKKQNPNYSNSDDNINVRASHINQSLSRDGRVSPKQLSSPLRPLPTNTLAAMAGGASFRKTAFEKPNLGRLQAAVVEGRGPRMTRQGSDVENLKRKSGTVGFEREVLVVPGRRPSLASFEDHEELGREAADRCDDVAFRSPPWRPTQEPNGSHSDSEEELEASHYNNEEENEDVTMESSEETAVRNVVQDGGVHDTQNTMEIQITLAEETEKRKLRRQAQSAREKEGCRRKKEGLPRNFLLVDEYSQMPYSVGVGDWRKELMLLSQNLDPAIGNINQQPEGAVAEIAQWIQHTWEYSSPVKFAFVKEVIARGVTLRRADLWKKIRNNEPKPEKVSDRSWRILQRQLESPATIRKSESCSKANASRVNFGRTGPSGEVGVRERLRRALRRSPDPEEIQFEMARDKGYGGRQKRKYEELKVMHGRGVEGQLPRLAGRVGNDNYNTIVPYADVGHDVHEGDHGNDDSLADAGIARTLSGGGVQALSASEIAQHPLVMKMMDRLEALEARYSVSVDDHDGAQLEKCSLAADEDDVQAASIDKRTAELQSAPTLINDGYRRKPHNPVMTRLDNLEGDGKNKGKENYKSGRSKKRGKDDRRDKISKR